MLLDWRGETVICIASGPSLTAEDCELVRGRLAIVTNTTFRACPWAAALYAFDRQWWNRYIDEVRKVFAGRKFCQSQRLIRKDIECARKILGFRSFGNSGACAASMAISAGAKRLVLLGYDCGYSDGRSHHHGDHPDGLRNCDTMPRWPAQFERLAAYAVKRGVEIVNASRTTALTCFQRVDLADAL